MMKKFLRTALLAALVLSLVSGCSLFASGNGGSGDGKSGSSGAIKMTDNFTFEDPADLDFDTRYVICCDETSTMIANMDASLGIIAAYSIYYAKDDAPVADYEFYVCDTEEHAQAAADLLAAQGTVLTAAEGDSCVRYATMDGDAMEAAIVMFQSYGMMEEATVSAYVEFMQTTTGGKLME